MHYFLSLLISVSLLCLNVNRIKLYKEAGELPPKWSWLTLSFLMLSVAIGIVRIIMWVVKLWL